MPRLLALLICNDVVQHEDDLIDLVGVTQGFTVDSLPVEGEFKVFSAVDDLTVGPKQITIRFEELGGALAAEFQQPTEVLPEHRGRLWQMHDIALEIRLAGEYELVYLIDGEELERLTFWVEQVAPLGDD